jgi:O-antigen ligase
MTNRLDIQWIGFLIFAALLGGVLLSMRSPLMIVLIPTAFIAAVLLLNDAKLSLFLTVMILPLLGTTVMSANILPVPGAKASNLILFIALVGFLLNTKINLFEVKPAAFFYFGSLLLLLTAVLRADHVAPYSMYFWEEAYTPAKFFLSNMIVPGLRSIPFIMIIVMVRHRSQIDRLAKYLAFSMLLFSATIITIYMIRVPGSTDFQTARDTIAVYLGMHGNNMADFFLVGIPFMFALSLDKQNPHRKLLLLAAVVSLTATTITYSRAAYFIIIVAVFLVILMTKKYRLFIPVIVIGILIATLMPSVVDRALTGFETGEIEEITAGRTSMIWRGIARETGSNLMNAPEKLILGYGRFGYMATDDFRNMRVLRVTHAHNMYLDTLMDTGVVGLLFYLYFFAWIILKLVRMFFNQRHSTSHPNRGRYLVTGLLVAILSFLARGMVGSVLLPQLTNVYLYIILAITFVVIRCDVNVDEATHVNEV